MASRIEADSFSVTTVGSSDVAISETYSPKGWEGKVATAEAWVKVWCWALAVGAFLCQDGNSDRFLEMANFLEFLKSELPKPTPASDAPLILDLFAGCGGLALGFECAGFRTLGYEKLRDACETYGRNLHGVCHEVTLTEHTQYPCAPDIVIGGPPCQPFSVGGLQMGSEDPRDGFPAYLSAVKRFRPKIAVFENVRGMLYRGRPYLEEIIRYLEDLDYVVQTEFLNSVDYGVPQRRERLFVVAHRGIWKTPRPRGSAPFTAGDAVSDLLGELPPAPKFLTKSMDEYVAKYEKASCCIRPRDLHMNKPARTVTCRNLNGATGDMMRIRLEDGRRRRVTVREGARLQGFPDWFEFSGNEGSQFNQVGNAVPPLLGKAVAGSVLACYFGPTLTAHEIRSARRELLEQPSLF